MKKKIFLIALMIALFSCFIAISVSAKDINTGYLDLDRNEIIVPTYDSEGNSLIWVRSTRLDRAEQYGIALANGKNYYEISDNDTTYYIFGQKSQDAFVVDNSYTLEIVTGRGVSSDTILVANFDGLFHADGTGAQHFGFLMRNRIIKYVYIQSSFKSTKNPNSSNTQVFLEATNLSQVEFAPGSQITELGSSAFKKCPITKIVLPEGLTSIDERAFDGCSSLKEIYIPKTVTFIDEIAFQGVNGATYYFTGSKETTNGWEITDEIRYVNHCDIYYGGKHQIGEPTCSRCGEDLYCENPEHNLEINITYENYSQNGVKTVRCLDCNSQQKEITVPAIFTAEGYSISGDGKSLLGGYKINTSALQEYNAYKGTKLTYGIIMSNSANVTVLDGKYIGDKGVMATENNEGYTTIKYVISGFNATEQLVDLNLVITLYVVDESGMSFVQNDTAYDIADASVEGKTVKVNAITFGYIAQKTIGTDADISNEYKEVLEAIIEVSKTTVTVVPPQDEEKDE